MMLQGDSQGDSQAASRKGWHSCGAVFMSCKVL